MLTRRDLLEAAALPWVGGAAGPRFRGVFPVLGAPGDVRNLRGAQGVIWPGRDDAESVMAEARLRGLAVILCVQGPDLLSTRRRARQAEKLGADAVMAAPLRDPRELERHYGAIAAECGRPLVAHAAGHMSIEFLLRMRERIPALRMVKDEAGHTLSRISEYRRVAPELAVFTAATGRLLADALERGAAGAMPPAWIWRRCASS